MAFYDNGQYLIYSYDDYTLITHVETGKVISRWNHHLINIRVFGDTLAAYRKIRDDPGDPEKILQKISLFNIPSGTIIGEFDEKTLACEIRIRLNNKMYLTKSPNRIVVKHISNNSTVLSYVSYTCGTITEIEFSGNNIIVGYTDGDCKAIDIYTGKTVAKYECKYRGLFTVNCIICSPDTIHVVVIYYNHLFIWNIQTNVRIKISGFFNYHGITFSPDGSLFLVTTRLAKTITVCDIRLYSINPFKYLRLYYCVPYSKTLCDMKFYRGHKMFVILYLNRVVDICKIDYCAEFDVLRRCLLPELCNIIGEYAAINGSSQLIWDKPTPV